MLNMFLEKADEVIGGLAGWSLHHFTTGPTGVFFMELHWNTSVKGFCIKICEFTFFMINYKINQLRPINPLTIHV
jgi:hypothetical protein